MANLDSPLTRRDRRRVERPPAPDLAPYVEKVRILDDAARHAVEILPDGRTRLLVRITAGAPGTATNGDVSFRGPSMNPIYKAPPPIPLAVQVVFRPGGARSLLGIGLDATAGRVVRVEDLWPDGVPFRDRLFEARDAGELVLRLEQALIARRRHVPPTVTLALRAARAFEAGVRAGRTMTAASIADQLGVSPRHLRRAFSDGIGLSPKQYAMMLRFQRALALLESEDRTSLGQVAQACGYFDQSHFNREFKRLGGLSPRAFRLRRVRTNGPPRAC